MKDINANPLSWRFASGVGQTDTRKGTGRSYDTIGLTDLEAMVKSPPPAAPKGKGQWLIPSTYAADDARGQVAQRNNGEFGFLIVDIDKGDVSLETVSAALDAVLPGVRRLIYSTSSAKPGDRRWRVLIPLLDLLPGRDFADVQSALFDAIEEATAGAIITDRALARAAQISYLPGRGALYEDEIADGDFLDLHEDHPLIVRAEAASKERAEADAAAKLRQEQRQREREARGPDAGETPVEQFDRNHAVEDLLEKYGYKRLGGSNRWRSPYQTSRGSYATLIVGDHWISRSGSDDANDLGAVSAAGSRHGDSFDLFCHYEHGGDFTAAVRAYAEAAGLGAGAETIDYSTWTWGSKPEPEEPAEEPAEEPEAEPEDGDDPSGDQQQEQEPGAEKKSNSWNKSNSSQAPWPAPDTSLLAPERPPAPELPGMEVFGPVWGRWLLETAECKSAPPDYVAAGLLSTASSLIGNARWATPWDGWSEPPTVWSMLIGLPSAGKSPALDATVVALRVVERRLRAAAERDHAEWSARAETAKLAEDVWKANVTAALRAGKPAPDKPSSTSPGEQPHIPRLAVSDVTLERLCQIIAKQPKGVLMLRDELAGWLTNMSRYSKGDDRGFWVEAYGGRPYPVDRLTRASGTIDRLLVTVVGGIQPDRLRSLLLKTDDDGMPSRFLPFWPDPVPLRRPSVPPDEDLPERAFTRLDGLEMPVGGDGDPRPWFVPFSEPARVLLHEFRVSLGKTEADSSGMLQSFIGKMPGLAVRLSLVLAALDWSVGERSPFPSEITVDHLGRAAHFIEAYVIPMARRTYNETSVPVEEQAGRTLAKMIVDEGWRSFTSRQVQLKKRGGLRDKREIDAALELLVSAAWIVAAPEPTPTKPRRSYLVNPSVWRKP